MPVVCPFRISTLNPSSRRESRHSAPAGSIGTNIERPKIKFWLILSKSPHFSTAPAIPLIKLSSSGNAESTPLFMEAGVIPSSASLFSPTLLTTSVAIHSAVSSESTAPDKNSSSPTGIAFANSSAKEPGSSVSMLSSAVVSVTAGASVSTGASVVEVDSVVLPEQAAPIMQIDINKQRDKRFILFLNFLFFFNKLTNYFSPLNHPCSSAMS